MKRLILIKLGGSLISDKEKVSVARTGVIKKLGQQIKRILTEDKNLSLIIATGAGGFGHPVAKKYRNDLAKGLPFIRAAVRKLNKIVVDTMINYGVKAISVSPSSIATYKGGKMVALLDSDIVALLKKNIIPVFHADLVNDRTLGTSILSMDRFLVDLAIFFKNKDFEVKRVIFVGTTPGVFDKNGKTIPKITKKDFPKIQEIFYEGRGVDVSGGMKYKVKECLRAAGGGIDSHITNSLSLQGTLVTK